MNIFTELDCDLLGLKSCAINLANNTNIGDIFLLTGDLGVGKTTFTRFFINSLYDKYSIEKPKNIKSPSYPILINYPLLNFEIFHYDLYRVKNENELTEIGFLENYEKNITLIEWPEIIIKKLNLYKYYSIIFEFINEDKRKIKIKYFDFNDS